MVTAGVCPASCIRAFALIDVQLVQECQRVIERLEKVLVVFDQSAADEHPAELSDTPALGPARS